MVQGAVLLLQGVSADHLPHSGITAGAGPAPADGATAGQVVLSGHAGLAKEKRRKRKRSMSGVASGSLQTAFLAQAC